MADHVSINATNRPGGPIVATDDIGGVHYQRVKVTYGSDGSATDVTPVNPLPVTMVQVSGSASVSEVNASVTSVLILGSNALRKGMFILNDSNQILYLKFGSPASPTSYTFILEEGDLYEPIVSFTGNIYGIWSGANGSARVTEFT